MRLDPRKTDITDGLRLSDVLITLIVIGLIAGFVLIVAPFLQ